MSCYHSVIITWMYELSNGVVAIWCATRRECRVYDHSGWVLGDAAGARDRRTRTERPDPLPHTRPTHATRHCKQNDTIYKVTLLRRPRSAFV